MAIDYQMLSFQMERLRGLAKKHNMEAEIDLSNPARPIVNFVGGTEEEQHNLAMEMREIVEFI
jgi:hypothetical protein